MKYDYKAVEAKWQKVWEDEKTFHVEIDHKKPKFYALVEFPYPSGAGLHVGHPRSYTALDVVSRKRRQNGYNVLYPMGWDAFGLPTENFAMKNHIHPAIVTKNNVDHFRSQLKALGFSFDWDREINTTDPEYYKWTQWIFLQLYKHGLAYKKEMNVNWCTGCKCVLANEEVVNGVCERCGSEVVHRVKSQWMLKITAYADKLIDGLDGLDYIERVATQQKNWIGRSHGAEVNFGTTAGDTLTVYTTRCDTLFGATYMVVSPEHAMVKEWLDKGILKNADAVKAYQAEAARKSDFERSELNKEKTGVKLEGVMGINPVNDTEIPIFISDYVLSTYGTGAIMAVPAHDTRDWEFAKKFGLPIIEVVKGNTPSNLDEAAFTDVATGTLVNSGFLNGLSVTDAKKKMIDWLEANGKGCDKVNYKLRDWVFSRQRYWGEPIPMVKCEKCGWQPLPESSLPLTLPDITDFEPGPDGESPLARHKDWVKTTCPCCGGPATRETDTMPQWAGSSWYFLRYMDPHCKDAIASKEALEYWSPVDWYNGGMEHTTLHLLYSRFWHKFLYDIGAVPSPEPYQKRTAHGMILGLNPHSFVNLPAEEQEKLLKEYGSQKAAEKALEEKYGEMSRHPIVKMSKSLGNTIDPSDVNKTLGAEVLRLWTSSVDYGQDVSIGDEILQRTSETYRKFRNTFRFLLGNLDNFDDQTDCVAWDELEPIDQYMMVKTAAMLDDVTKAFDDYRFHHVYRVAYDFVTDLSNVYMDVAKDRLYSEAPESPRRRAVQTVLMNILEVMVRVLAPVLTFTTEEVWQHYPEAARGREGRESSVQLCDWPTRESFVPALPAETEQLEAQWATIMEVRDVVTKALEEARGAKVIKKSQEASVEVTVPAGALAVLSTFDAAVFEELFIVAGVRFIEGSELGCEVVAAQGEKCPRCWNFRELGGNANHPHVCKRCGDALDAIGFEGEE